MEDEAEARTTGLTGLAGVDEAWRELRRRVADHLAWWAEAAEPEEELVLTVRAASGAEGPAPTVTAAVPAHGGWRLTSSGHVGGDGAPGTSPRIGSALRALGWTSPSGPDEPWVLDLDVADLERAAWVLVRTLREVHGVVHPAFLLTPDLDLDGLRARKPLPPRRPTREQRLAAVEALPVVRPEDAEHLARLVRETVEAMSEADVEVDDDGDLLWPCGEGSLAFVHVDEERPVIHLFSILVLGLTHPRGIPAALDLVSRRLPWLAARIAGDRLLVHHELCAMPYAPQHLTAWLARLSVEVDEVAAEAAELLGGRRMLEDHEDHEDHEDLEGTGHAEGAEKPGDADGVSAPRRQVPASASVPAGLDEDLAVVVELLVDGPVEPRLVAEVFAHDRRAVVRRLVGLRQGLLRAGPVDVVDLEELLDTLRAGLRWIVEEPVRAAELRRRARRRVAPRPTVQAALLDDEPDLFESDLFELDAAEPDMSESEAG